MIYFKYIVETRRFLGGWFPGAIWGLDSKDFRAFLDYINSCDNREGAQTRVKRVIEGVAKYEFPRDSVT